MLRDGWNFHNDIAMALESIARNQFGNVDRPFGKIYDADSIETGCFIEVMIILLRLKSKMEDNNDDITEFVKSCSEYLGESGNDIPNETAQNLLDRFIRIFDLIE